ncbi:cystathionine beta-lyase [Capnocytophaga haemolytica]|uniref:cysteine-S-conjugate beta-lyase n=1 Tax=Capnocytophaga haemolytica TaxID=45243 RepID=A0AAX2GZ36_9FLAO|nr:PLP-dependent aspartate aminotransferase family protein [Capnocytophaga haemolytica]AMD84830.1 cystathionine gamma-synthase [Capnocytophaga haemolytica]SFN75730.1 cystathionine beta-lyase [Capnocytophaga haemolytica]SNV06999.1 Cystathionine gamma-synthase [Capnocytophaga haemolytica]
MKFETKAIHGVRSNGEKVEEWGSTINMASTFPIREFGVEQEFEYSRVSNPTRRELERLLAQLESGKHGFAFSSGMAAISTLLSVFEAGDHFIFGLDIYGGTFRIIRDIFGKFGLKASFVDTTNLENIRKAILPSTKGIFIETPSNPLLDITDIEGVVAIAREHKLITIVDNTFMSPYLQRPLELGADVVVHSATKFLSGHNDIIAGAIVLNDDALSEKISFAQVAIGAMIAPFDSWLLMRSIKTLKVRMDYAQSNTEALVHYLKLHPAVEKVYYPTEADAERKAIHQRQASGGGAVFSFVLKDEKKVKSFFESLKVALFAVSLGGVETLVTHPSTLTHTEFPEEEKVARGVTQTLVRVAVGIENINDLIADFKQALEA